MATERHIPALDGIRGVAILIVVAYHTGGGAKSSNPLLHAFGMTLKAGWAGVTLFFVLSGFLITGILWDSKRARHWWRNFYARRALRIWPLYYGALALAAITGLAQHRAIASLWVYALYLQNVPGLPGVSEATPLHLGHFWSLAVEEQFYLIWPLVLYGCSSMRSVKRVCGWVFAGSLLFRVAVWSGKMPGAFSGFLLAHAGELAAGAWLAMAYRDGSWEAVARHARWISPLALAGFVASALAGRSFEATNAAVDTVGLAWITVFFAGLIVLALQPGALRRSMSLPALRWVGKISYGIYVYHVLLEPMFAWIAAGIAPRAVGVEAIAVRGLVVWVGSFVIAWASYELVEARILRLRVRFSASAKAGCAVAS